MAYQLQYNDSLSGPREATASNCPECLWKTPKRKHLLILYFFPFFLLCLWMFHKWIKWISVTLPHKAGFMLSVIPSALVTFILALRHFKHCWFILSWIWMKVTLWRRVALALRGGFHSLSANSLKNTHPLQFSGFILNVISLSLLNLEIKSFWTQQCIISTKIFFCFNPSRWFGRIFKNVWKGCECGWTITMHWLHNAMEMCSQLQMSWSL